MLSVRKKTLYYFTWLPNSVCAPDPHLHEITLLIFQDYISTQRLMLPCKTEMIGNIFLLSPMISFQCMYNLIKFMKWLFVGGLLGFVF